MSFFRRLFSKSVDPNFIPEKPSFMKQNFIYSIDSIKNRPQAHASNIINGGVKDGIQKLYVSWFCGSREGNRDVGILFSEITYSTEFEPTNVEFQYSVPRLIADHPTKALGNPVLFLDSSNIMHLWYVEFEPNEDHPKDRKRDILYKRSSDLGKNWSEPILFSDRKGMWPRNNVLVLKNGTWLLPLNDETTYLPEFKTKWSSRFAFSTDEGVTWDFSDLYSIEKGMIQPSVVQLADSSLYCINRSKTGWITDMRSIDNGQSWSEPQNTNLPNPNSNVCMIRTLSNDLVMAYNPVKKGRTPISIARSKDNGHTWTRLFDLQTIKGEFSYPCMIQTEDGLIHITYTYKRRTISHDIIQLT